MSDTDIIMEYLKSISSTQQQQSNDITNALVGIQELKTMTIKQESDIAEMKEDIDCLQEFKDNAAGGMKVLNWAHAGIAGLIGSGITLMFTYGDKISEWVGGKP